MSNILTLENFAKYINTVTSPLLNCTPEIRNKRWGVAHMTLYFMYTEMMFPRSMFARYHFNKAQKYIPNTMSIFRYEYTVGEIKEYIKNNPNLEREELAFIYYIIGIITDNIEYYNKSFEYGLIFKHHQLITINISPNIDKKILFNTLVKNKECDILVSKYAYICLLSTVNTKPITFDSVYTQEYIDNHVYNYLCTLDESTMPGYYLICKWEYQKNVLDMNINLNQLIDKLSINQMIEYIYFLKYISVNLYNHNVLNTLLNKYKYFYHELTILSINNNDNKSVTNTALHTLKYITKKKYRNQMYEILAMINKSDPEKCFDYFSQVNIKHIPYPKRFMDIFKDEIEKGYHNVHRVKWTVDRHKYFGRDNATIICILLCSKYRNNSHYPIPPKFVMLLIYEKLN